MAFSITQLVTSALTGDPAQETNDSCVCLKTVPQGLDFENALSEETESEFIEAPSDTIQRQSLLNPQVPPSSAIIAATLAPDGGGVYYGPALTPSAPRLVEEQNWGLNSVTVAHNGKVKTNSEAPVPWGADGQPLMLPHSEGAANQASDSAPKVTLTTLVRQATPDPLASSGLPNIRQPGDTEINEGLAPVIGIGANSPASAAPSAPAHPATQLPHHISAQICDALETYGARDIEIRLDPEELGRVRIVLSTKDGRMNVAVFSDRAEVLDLMRRNSDLLEAGFSDIGYDGASFSFQRERDGNQKQAKDVQDPRDIEPHIDSTIAQLQQSICDDARLDLRY